MPASVSCSVIPSRTESRPFPTATAEHERPVDAPLQDLRRAQPPAPSTAGSRVLPRPAAACAASRFSFRSLPRFQETVLYLFFPARARPRRASTDRAPPAAAPRGATEQFPPGGEARDEIGPVLEPGAVDDGVGPSSTSSARGHGASERRASYARARSRSRSTSAERSERPPPRGRSASASVSEHSGADSDDQDLHRLVPPFEQRRAHQVGRRPRVEGRCRRQRNHTRRSRPARGTSLAPRRTYQRQPPLPPTASAARLSPPCARSACRAPRPADPDVQRQTVASSSGRPPAVRERSSESSAVAVRRSRSRWRTRTRRCRGRRPPPSPRAAPTRAALAHVVLGGVAEPAGAEPRRIAMNAARRVLERRARRALALAERHAASPPRGRAASEGGRCPGSCWRALRARVARTPSRISSPTPPLARARRSTGPSAIRRRIMSAYVVSAKSWGRRDVPRLLGAVTSRTHANCAAPATARGRQIRLGRATCLSGRLAQATNKVEPTIDSKRS